MFIEPSATLKKKMLVAAGGGGAHISKKLSEGGSANKT
jgi:hypothetical protein